jgi:predicted nucleic acid-binding protein
MARVLFDTDVLVDQLQGKKPISPRFEGSAYSSISRAELYSWPRADERIIDRLLDQFEEIAVDRQIAEEAGRIRRETEIRLPDALIAATALVSKRPLHTRNRRDFSKVRRLRLHK